MKIVLYIRMYTLSANRDALNLAYDYHYFWQGEENHHIYRGFMDKIWSRGRLPDQDGVWLLNELSEVERGLEIVKVVDGGSLAGWGNAFLHGIVKFPALVVDGKKYQGRQACRLCLDDLKRKE